MYSHVCLSVPPDKPGRTCKNSSSLSVMMADSLSLLYPNIRRQSVQFKSHMITCPPERTNDGK